MVLIPVFQNIRPPAMSIPIADCTNSILLFGALFLIDIPTVYQYDNDTIT